MRKEKSFFCIACLVIIGAILVPVFCLAQQELIITQVQIAGENTNYDFVEIYNPKGTAVNLGDFKLRKKSKTGTEYSLKSFAAENIIPAQGYYLWACSKDGYDIILQADTATTQTLAVNNSIAILDDENNIIDALAWGEGLENPFVFGSLFVQNPEPNQSLQRKKDQNDFYQNTRDNSNDFEINLVPQPKNSSFSGPTDQTPPENEPGPNVSSSAPSSLLVAQAGADIFALAETEVQFDGSGCYANSYRPLEFFWNFGDGTTSKESKPKHIYQFLGQYIVSLTVSDGKNSKTDTLTAFIYQGGLFINEFLPQKNGWIELNNASQQILNLENWQLTDKNQNKRFIFPVGSFIAPGQLLVLSPPVEKIDLRGPNGSLCLIYPNGSISQQIEYQDRPDGWSVNQTEGSKYFLSSSPTPGTANIISGLSSQEEPPFVPNGSIMLEPALPQTAQMPKTPKPLINSQTTESSPIFSTNPAPQQAEPPQIGLGASEQQTLLAENENEPSQPLDLMVSLADHGQKPKAANLVLSISIAFSFALLAGWSMMLFKKAIKK